VSGVWDKETRFCLSSKILDPLLSISNVCLFPKGNIAYLYVALLYVAFHNHAYILRVPNWTLHTNTCSWILQEILSEMRQPADSKQGSEMHLLMLRDVVERIQELLHDPPSEGGGEESSRSGVGLES
jgi:hypothetical protein